MKTESHVVFPKSKFHIQLLKSNNVNVINVCDVYNLNWLELHCSLLELPYCNFDNEVFSTNPFKFTAMKNKNKAFYSSLNDYLLSIPKNTTIILFNEYTPVSRFIIDTVGAKRVELWEDGLNHYLKEHGTFKFFFKGVAKLLNGYYPKRMFTKEDRDGLLVKDRFVNKNLSYNYTSPQFVENGSCYFIGQPLVEDGLISSERFISSLSKLKEFVLEKHDINQFFYIPHPRESNSLHIAKLERVWGEIVTTNLSAEDFLTDVKSTVIVSSFSTVNYNIDFINNYLVPTFFGFHSLADRLKRIPADDINLKVL